MATTEQVKNLLKELSPLHSKLEDMLTTLMNGKFLSLLPF